MTASVKHGAKHLMCIISSILTNRQGELSYLTPCAWEGPGPGKVSSLHRGRYLLNGRDTIPTKLETFTERLKFPVKQFQWMLTNHLRHISTLSQTTESILHNWGQVPFLVTWFSHRRFRMSHRLSRKTSSNTLNSAPLQGNRQYYPQV